MNEEQNGTAASKVELPENIKPVNGLKDNYLILDQYGNQHEMVEIPTFLCAMGNTFHPHPAFIVDGKLRRIFIGKYQASILDGKYVIQKNGMVAHSINFDNSNQACNDLNNGSSITGFHLISNTEWAVLTIISHQVMNGVRVQGNNRYGKDFSSKTIMGMHEPYQKEFKDNCFPARWLAGSGGIVTSHNGNESGIYDLNGNILEWVKGLRLNDGEINIIPDNNSAISLIDVSKSSSQWKAILEDGTLVEPGTEGALKFDDEGRISKFTKRNWSGHIFKDTICADDVSPDCAGVELLKKLTIFPSVTGPHDDYFWFDTNGESIPLRGGYWNDGAGAGLRALNLYGGRGGANGHIGFRVAFVL
jgi:hypothetical protein